MWDINIGHVVLTLGYLLYFWYLQTCMMFMIARRGREKSYQSSSPLPHNEYYWLARWRSYWRPQPGRREARELVPAVPAVPAVRTGSPYGGHLAMMTAWQPHTPWRSSQELTRPWSWWTRVRQCQCGVWCEAISVFYPDSLQLVGGQSSSSAALQSSWSSSSSSPPSTSSPTGRNRKRSTTLEWRNPKTRYWKYLCWYHHGITRESWRQSRIYKTKLFYKSQ